MKILREKKTVKCQGGDSNEEGSPDPSDNSQCIEKLPDRSSQGIKTPQQTPILNPDPFQHWHRIKNIARVKINSESWMALLYNGTQIKTLMPKYVSDHSLEMGLITNLLGAKVTCVGLGNAYTILLGYVIIWVQVDGVQGYDKDHIALVIPDLSNFVAPIPVILGTPTISCISNVMKEVEIDALGRCQGGSSLIDMPDDGHESGWWHCRGVSWDDYNQVMFTQNVETIEAFSSHMVLVKVGRAYTGECINIMV